MCQAQRWLRSKGVKLLKSIITALFCAVLIGTNVWLFAMSWFDDAFMTWSTEARIIVGLHLGGHAALALGGLLGLGFVKTLWISIFGALTKAGVLVWSIIYTGGAALSQSAPQLVVFWLLVSAAIYLVIRWNYSESRISAARPEREFA